MVYRCKKCGRVLANIKSLKNMVLKGKSIEIEGDNIVITCPKCKEKLKLNVSFFRNV